MVPFVMSSPAPFHVFGQSHQAVLLTTVLVILMMAVFRRRRKGLALIAERLLGISLLLTWPATTLGHWLGGTLSYDNMLPCHFCDIASMSGGVAMLTRNRLACEILYFFGMAGTLQGLLTPNLKFDYPDARFFAFFLIHSGVVIAAVHAVTSMACPPRPGAISRMLLITAVYGFTAGAINAALGVNYGFLCRKPEVASLMDHLGPWPWYIASLLGLCVIFYTVLNLPFLLWRSLSRARSK